MQQMKGREKCNQVTITALQTGHLADLGASLRPWKSSTEAAEQAQPLQKR